MSGGAAGRVHGRVAGVVAGRRRRGAAGALAVAVAVALAIALAPSRASAEPWRLAFEGGGQLDARPFGVLNLTAARAPWTLRLVTDTFEAEVGGRAPGGRAWAKVRLQAFASQMLLSPWTDGEPDPARALLSPHVGAEVGWVGHLPGGLYAGGVGFARGFWFFRTPDTVGPAPDPTWWVSGEAVAGWWRGPDRRVEVRGGVDLGDGFAAPKVAVEAVLAPPGVFVPRLEVRAGWARDQSELVRTRLGGLNPYVVPLAGAGWAEFWVERYAVVRVGPEVRWRVGRPTDGRAALVADLATFEGRREVAFAALAGQRLAGGWFLDVRLGWAPWLERADGVLAVSAWLLVGRAFPP